MAKDKTGFQPERDESALAPLPAETSWLERDAQPVVPVVQPQEQESEEPKAPPTVHDHAAATGNLAKTAPAFSFGEQRQRYSWQHEAAAQLHGWKAHEQATVDKLHISREDYESALKAALEPVARLRNDDGTFSEPLTAQQVKALKDTSKLVSRYEPHRAALSEFAAKEEQR
jgi:hypothetical protein